MYLLVDFGDFQPWSDAVEVWELIKDEGKVDELESILEDIYPEGMTDTQLNDLLRFDTDEVLGWLGIETEEKKAERIRQEAMCWWNENKYLHAPEGTDEQVENLCDNTPCKACPYGFALGFEECTDEMVADICGLSVEGIVELYKESEGIE